MQILLYSFPDLNMSFANDTSQNSEAKKHGGLNINKHSKL